MFVACSVPPPGCIPSPTQLRIEPSHVNGRDRISLGSSRRPRVILIRHKAGARVLTGGGPSASCLLLAEQREKKPDLSQPAKAQQHHHLERFLRPEHALSFASVRARTRVPMHGSDCSCFRFILASATTTIIANNAQKNQMPVLQPLARCERYIFIGAVGSGYPCL